MAKQVIAYESFNGKLFPTLEKCEAYEKKMSKYPYSTDKTTQLVDCMTGETLDMIRHDITEYFAPNISKRQTFFILSGKYKMIVGDPDIFDKLYDISVINNNDRSLAKSKVIAKLILQGNEITTQYLQKNLGEEVIVEELPQNKWRMSQKGWYWGAKIPDFYTIERIC